MLIPDRIRRRAVTGAMIALALLVSEDATSRSVADDRPPATKVSVFAKREISERVAKLRRDIALLFQEDEFQKAKRKATVITKLMPDEPVGYYLLATIWTQLNQPDAAMVSLTRAVQLGMRDPHQLQSDPDFMSLHARDDWDRLIKAAELPFHKKPTTVTIKPEVITSHVALVKESNSVWDPRTQRIHSFFRQTAEDRKAQLGIATGNAASSRLLRKWQKEGTAAGHKGILYDNHDRDHSSLDARRFPQLTRIEYSEEVKQRKLDNGAQSLFAFNGIVFGNSSTAVVNSPYWRSQPRLMYCTPQAINALALQYFGNHVYIYPEHRDYDPGDEW